MNSMERPIPSSERKLGWGSDAAAQTLRDLGYRYVAMTPDSSTRGFHDSVVNYLGNREPPLLLCLHEEHAVAIAHGYAKVSGEPMAVALHTRESLDSPADNRSTYRLRGTCADPGVSGYRPVVDRGELPKVLREAISVVRNGNPTGIDVRVRREHGSE